MEMRPGLLMLSLSVVLFSRLPTSDSCTGEPLLNYDSRQLSVSASLQGQQKTEQEINFGLLKPDQPGRAQLNADLVNVWVRSGLFTVTSLQLQLLIVKKSSTTVVFEGEGGEERETFTCSREENGEPTMDGMVLSCLFQGSVPQVSKIHIAIDSELPVLYDLQVQGCADVAEVSYFLLDTVVLLDGTSYVSDSDFESAKSFIKNLVLKMDVFGACGIRVSVITYGGDTQWGFASPQSDDVTEFNLGVDNLVRSDGGEKSLASVLNAARNTISAKEDRLHVPNQVVFISSGQSNKEGNVAKAVRKLKKKASIVVVGLGANQDTDQLSAIAGSSDEVHFVGNVNQIAEQLKSNSLEVSECTDSQE